MSMNMRCRAHEHPFFKVVPSSLLSVFCCVKEVWVLVLSKMEFEELKVEIPVDNDEEEEKDFPFNLVSKSKVIFFYRIYNFLEHLSIFYVVFCVTGKTI